MTIFRGVAQFSDAELIENDRTQDRTDSELWKSQRRWCTGKPRKDPGSSQNYCTYQD